jgi:hypothetical protein
MARISAAWAPPTSSTSGKIGWSTLYVVVDVFSGSAVFAAKWFDKKLEGGAFFSAR